MRPRPDLFDIGDVAEPMNAVKAGKFAKLLRCEPECAFQVVARVPVLWVAAQNVPVTLLGELDHLGPADHGLQRRCPVPDGGARQDGPDVERHVAGELAAMPFPRETVFSSSASGATEIDVDSTANTVSWRLSVGEYQ